MLQQTQVKTVIPYYERWMMALPTMADFARARPGRVLKLWEGLGYYRRVRLAQEAARLIMSKHAGRFPEKLDEILALPGVGRYTAGAICSIAFNQPAPILDGNVIRVLSRLLGIAGDPRSKTVNAKLWRAAEELVVASGVQLPRRPSNEPLSLPSPRCAGRGWPDNRTNFRLTLARGAGRGVRVKASLKLNAGGPSQLNQSLMELGALICLPRQPKCPACPLRRDCFALRGNRVEDFPTPSPKAVVTQRRFIALVVSDGERLLVRRRPAGVVNAGLWEFPNVEVSVNTKNLPALVAPFKLADRAPFLRVRHSITRYRMLLEAYRAELPAGPASAQQDAAWKNPAEIKKLPFASAHRKVLQKANESEEKMAGE